MTNGMKDEPTPRSTEDLNVKCIEDLRREYAKAIEERDEARTKQQCLRIMLEEKEKERDMARNQRDDECKQREEIKAKYEHLSEEYAKAITDLNELLETVKRVRDNVRSDRREDSRASLLEDVCHDLTAALAKHGEGE